MLCVALAAPARAAQNCPFRLSIGVAEEVAEQVAHAVTARYIDVLKDDVVFAPPEPGTIGEARELRLAAGVVSVGIRTSLRLTANRGCSGTLQSEVERIAASARERWREGAWRYDEAGQGLTLEIEVEMLASPG